MNENIKVTSELFQKQSKEIKENISKIESLNVRDNKNILNKNTFVISKEEYQKYENQFLNFKKQIIFLFQYEDQFEQILLKLTTDFQLLREENGNLKTLLKKEKEINQSNFQQFQQYTKHITNLQNIIKTKENKIQELMKEIKNLQNENTNLLLDSLPNLTSNPNDYLNDTRKLTKANLKNQEIKDYQSVYNRKETNQNANIKYPYKEQFQKEIQDKRKLHFENSNLNTHHLKNDNVEENIQSKNHSIQKKEFRNSKIPNYDKTIFVWIEFQNTNIFYHSIRELVIIDIHNHVLFEKNFISYKNGEELYSFEKYKKEIEMILNQYTNFVSFQTSEKIKYLFGNLIANTNMNYYDVYPLYKKVENDIFSNDILICAQTYDSKIDLFNRSSLYKTQILRNLYIELFKKMNDENQFFEIAKLPNFEIIMDSWELETMKKPKDTNSK